MKRQSYRFRIYYKSNLIGEKFCPFRAIQYYVEKIAARMGVKFSDLYYDKVQE